MKKLFTFLFGAFFTVSILAQVPEKLSFQAIVRNTANQLVANTQVGLRISILKNETPVFVETHSALTNSNGLVSLEIGAGTFVSGVSLSDINWSDGIYFIKTETDPTGGTNYTISGTSQLMSVPYALHAKKSGSSLQDVLTSGSSAEKVLNNESRNSILLNTTGGNASDLIFNGFSSIIAGTNGTNNAIRGMSNGINAHRNYGVVGVATNSGDLNTGVYGRAYGTKHNYGIWGVASDAIDEYDNRGVIGYSRDKTLSGRNLAVTGWAGNSDVLNIAVVAYVDESTTTGATNIGVEAVATAVSTTGKNYGIFAEAANAAVNYAGFFNGNVTITGTFIQPSDKKLKTNIQPILSALDKIDALKPVSFNYNSKANSSLKLPENSQYGFIAQDVEQILPNLVYDQAIDIYKRNSSPEASKNANKESIKEEFKGINYTGLISILTQGIKEQQQQIQSLITKNADYEERIKKLEKTLLGE